MRLLKVLLIEDEPALRKETEATLRRAKYSVKPASDFGEAGEILRKAGGEMVVLSELSVGGESAVKFLKDTLRRYPQVPFILLAKSPPLELVIEALKQGAYDFLRKPVDPGILCHSVARSVEKLNMSIEGERQEKEIRELLSRSREELKKSSSINRFMGFLISTAAHDFRGLLTVLDGYHQIILEKCFKGCIAVDRIDLLEQSRRSIARLRTMCDTLLDYHAAEEGKLKVAATSFALDFLLKECVDFYRPYAEQKRVRMELDLPLPAVKAKGDPNRCLQVLDNILYNAVKFTPADGEIRIGAMKEDGKTVTVWVHDSGAGIPEPIQKKILEGDRTLVGKDGDARIGLGLTICKKLLDSQKGKLWFENDHGKGLKVLFSLPT